MCLSDVLRGDFGAISTWAATDSRGIHTSPPRKTVKALYLYGAMGVRGINSLDGVRNSDFSRAQSHVNKAFAAGGGGGGSNLGRSSDVKTPPNCESNHTSPVRESESGIVVSL